MIKETKPIKELKDLNLLDRFLFAETTEDPENMVIILEIILGREVVLKHLPQPEKEERAFKWSKYVKLDVWAKDIEDKVYDTEVQKKDTKDLPKRSRLYNSVIDSKLMPSGSASYNDLNDVYIIIITPFDLFGKGKYMYTFRMKCDECSEVELQDGATRIFLNTRGTDDTGVSRELVELLKYIETTTEETAAKSSSAKIHKLHEKVSKIKSNEELGGKYMNLWEEKLLERQEAYAEGHSEAIRELAKKFKEEGIPLDVIARNTGLSIEVIRTLE